LPDHPFEELLEAVCRLGIIELEVDDDVAGIANGLPNLLRPPVPMQSRPSASKLRSAVGSVS
jgi:hypothetical protein